MHKILFNFSQLLVTMSVIVAIPTTSQAQDTNNPSTVSSGNSMIMSDTAFIRKDIRDNMMEIQLSQLGRQKSTDPQIKAVAQQMITDHTQILNELRRVARQKNMSNIASGGGSTRMGNAGSGMNNSGTAMTSMSGTGADTSGSSMSPATTGTGTLGTGVSSATRSATGTATTGMNSTNSGNRTLGTGMNSNSGTGTATSGTGITSGTGTSASGTSTTSGTGAGTGTSGTGTNSSGTAAVQHDMQGMSGMQDGAGMTALQNASGTQFNTLFVSQMLQMHQAKIAELQTGMTRITDPILLAAVSKALPKIKMHTDMLTKINSGINRNGQ